MCLGFYNGLVEMAKIIKKSKWSNILDRHIIELRAGTTNIEEMVFLYKVVVFLIDTFSTNPLETDAAHLFETLKQAHRKISLLHYL